MLLVPQCHSTTHRGVRGEWRLAEFGTRTANRRIRLVDFGIGQGMPRVQEVPGSRSAARLASAKAVGAKLARRHPGLGPEGTIERPDRLKSGIEGDGEDRHRLLGG